MVAHAYNHSYLGGRDQEDCGSKLVSKKLVRPHPNKLGVVVHACHSSYVGAIGRTMV
jgi:hypothetical protein